MVSEVVLISFNLFYFFPLRFIYFHHSIFHITFILFYLSYSTVGSLQSGFSLSYLLFITDWLLAISSRSLLNISCIFSVLVSSLFIRYTILLSRFWVIFTLIILNYFSGRLPISSSFASHSGHLSCSFTCWTFLCLFILFKLLCLECPF